MAGTSVGEIGLDLVVNQNQFNRQMSDVRGVAKKAGADIGSSINKPLSSIAGMAKKAGAALVAAFAVKKIAQFGKECLNLGSDLSEVQNVVDVTFPNMTAQVDNFAKSAAASFGLSETMAKKYTGTFGAMAKAFGFSESAAYDMGSTLTGLAGDVASFYNISQDEAYTKLKSVFTGETETLKDLGVVMTQNALDAYAMANGYGKTTQAMSEAEKVALRYAFVQDQLTAATGDFARTSGSWANQVRLMKLQFDGLKASIGQGLINLFTPVLKVINTLLGKLATLANAFKSFTELITGKKSSGGGISGGTVADVAEDLSTAAGSAGDVGSGANNAAKGLGAAEKAAKQLKNAMLGIDEVNIVSADEPSGGSSGGDGGSGSGGGGSAGGISGSPVDFGNLAQGETVLDQMDSSMQGFIDRCKELAALFADGFVIGFGDSQERIDEIKQYLGGIKQTLSEIFTDNEVVSAANRLFDSIALNAGKFAGSFASIGITIATNLIGGIDRYLQTSKNYIKKRLVKIFDAGSDILDYFGDLCVDIADIFSVFANADGQRITASIIGIFTDAGLGIVEILSRDIEHVFMVISDVISENKDGIKLAIENTLAPLAEVAEKIHETVRNTFSKISEIYDIYIDPAFTRIKDGLSTIFAAALEAYNTYLAPVLDWIADRFSVLVTEYVQPLLDAFLELWGKAAEAVSIFWEFISPFVAWFVDGFIAVFTTKLQWLWTKFEFVFSSIASVIKGIIEIFSGLIDFIVGVFTGNWDKAWKGIEEIFGGIWTAISGVAKSVWQFIRNLIDTSITAVKNVISSVLGVIKSIWTSAWNAMDKATGGALTTIKNTVQSVIDSIKRIFDGLVDFIGGIFTGDWERAWNGIKNIFGGIWDGLTALVKAPVNTVIGFLNKLLRGAESTINGIARMFNSLSIKIPDWSPVWPGATMGFNIPYWSAPQIPQLAQGGYVKPNTPQLAMIGDNRHQGEVVAPEDKLASMAAEAARLGNQRGMTEDQFSRMMYLLERIVELLQLLNSKDLNLILDGINVLKGLKGARKTSGYDFGG